MRLRKDLIAIKMVPHATIGDARAFCPFCGCADSIVLMSRAWSLGRTGNVKRRCDDCNGVWLQCEYLWLTEDHPVVGLVRKEPS